MKSLRHILKRLRCMKSNRCEKIHGDWWIKDTSYNIYFFVAAKALSTDLRILQY